jgi:hypothetical protein
MKNLINCTYPGCSCAEINEYGLCAAHYIDYPSGPGKLGLSVKEVQALLREKSKTAPRFVDDDRPKTLTDIVQQALL